MRTARWIGSVATAVALTIGALAVPTTAVADTAPPEGTPETVTADALPTVQIDGVVYAQEVVGNTVYVGGSFAKARPAGSPAGTNETPRANLLAYDLTTGTLISSWNPGTNGTVLDIKKSADGSRIYVAGSFSQASGAWRYRVAAFDTATGALVQGWAPEANGRIDGLAVTDTDIYLAGEFTTINGTQRTKIAAVSASTGAATPFTADVKGGYGAKAVVVSPDRSKIVISGTFTSVNGSTNPGRGITALNASTGTTMPWAMNSVLRNADATAKTYATMYSLASDGDSVYGTGTAHGVHPEAGFEGSFRANWSDGSLVWMEDCHGDSYDITPAGDTIYLAGHPHDCENIGGFPDKAGVFQNSVAFSKAPSGKLIAENKKFGGGGYANYGGKPAPSLLHWYPQYVPGTYTGQSQGPWQITTSGDYLLVGGEFLKVNGAFQQGIVRFATKTIAPNKQGPRVQGGAWALTVTSTGAANRLAWTANYDRDNTNLKYQVFRQDKGMNAPLYETTQSSNFWNPPEMEYLDTTAIPGAVYNYRVKATDSQGNTTQTDWKPVTVPNSSVKLASTQPNEAGASAQFAYTTELPNAKNWVVIYPKGQNPIAGRYLGWAYAPAASGTVDITLPDAPGTYTVWLLKSDGYERLSVGEDITVGPPSAVQPPASITAGSTATMTYTTGRADPANWIGVYAVGQTPGETTSAYAWRYAPGASGSIALSMPSTPGTYNVWFLSKGGYTPLGKPVTVTVG